MKPIRTADKSSGSVQICDWIPTQMPRENLPLHETGSNRGADRCDQIRCRDDH